MIPTPVGSSISMILYLYMSFKYVYKYRRNCIFCPELFVLMIGFVVSFFDILMSNYSDQSKLLSSFLSDQFPRTRYISMIGMSVFVNGLIYANLRDNSKIKNKNHFRNFPVKGVKILSILVIILLVITVLSGSYVAIFKYRQDVNHSDGLYGLLFTLISSLMMISSIIEFVRLHEAKYVYTNFCSFLKQFNKLYLFNIFFISFVLVVTGNRNDMLMFCLPPIVLFYYLIKRIPNKMILGGGAIGFFVMVLIGLTRTSGSSFGSVASEFNLYNIFRDFDAAYIDQYFLIQHTDATGPVGLANGINTVVSSIPFLGGLLLDEQKHTAEKLLDSNIVTTDYLNPGGAGMGTSLLGDLYYCGGLPFLIVYMFILGYMFAYVTQKLIKGYSVSLFLLVCFCYYFANITYLLRATWYCMFRPIGFSLIIYFILYLFTTYKKHHENFYFS